MIFFIPIMFIIFGLLFSKITPKKPNWVIGYRTLASMKNKDTWEMANSYCFKLWIYIGIAVSIITLIFYILFNSLININVCISLQVIIIALSIPLTEIKLMKEFDSEGNRRN